MTAPLRLLAIFPHPDDESLGTGCTIARYTAEGVDVHLLTATRGERGWTGDPAHNPGLAELGRIREAELMAAAKVLGLASVTFLDYIDGEVDMAPYDEITARIASHVRLVRPHVVLTFGIDGGYGHPDHIALSQFTSAALMRACDGTFIDERDLPAHSVSKLYHMYTPAEEFALYQEIFGDLVMHVDDVERRAVATQEWIFTTRIDTEQYWQVARDAVACHSSQVYTSLLSLPDEKLRKLWRYKTYYRVFSTVNGGRKIETDLFEGLREASLSSVQTGDYRQLAVPSRSGDLE